MVPLTSRPLGPARRLAFAFVVSSVAGAGCWFWWNAVWRDEIAFLPRRAAAEWMIYPSGPEGVEHPHLKLTTEFQRSFVLEAPPARAELQVAGFRSYAVRVNGAEVGPPARRGRNWKQPDRYEVGRHLRPGENQLSITVFNTNGPPALWLRLEAGDLEVRSDESWQASYAGASWKPAWRADKLRPAAPGNPLRGGERAGTGFQKSWPLLVGFALVSAAGCWLIRRYWLLLEQRREVVLLGGLVAAWAALFANNLSVLPNWVGFDATGHLDYIRYIQEHHSLPVATEGWEMFQPPLYYTLGALLLSAFSLSVTEDAGVQLLRILGLAVGVGHFVLVWASLRLLFPGDRAKPGWGLALAACLPPLLYLSHYVSNEGMAAALVSASVYLTLRALRAEQISLRLGAGLGACLGAALLTKSTAVLAVPAVFGALLWRAWFRPPGGARQMAMTVPRAALALGVCLAVGGWHYARVWARGGNPLVGAWDPSTGFYWWQDPGCLTGWFYLRFGEVFCHPWFSALGSFGDGIYSTLWGDGLLGGASEVGGGAPWDYDLMSLGYWLALVPAAGIMIGGAMALIHFLKRPAADWFLLLGLGFLMAVAVIHMSMSVPYYCTMKAFYGLSGLVPLCALGSLGLNALSRRGPKLWLSVCVLVGVWALNTYSSFWICRSSAATLAARAGSLADEGHSDRAREMLQAGVRAGHGNAEVRCLLARLLMMAGEAEDAIRQAEIVLNERPNDANGHLVMSMALARQQRLAEATAHARKAVELAPGRGAAYQQLAPLLVRPGHYEETIGVAREGLGVSAFSPELRFALGSALVFSGQSAEGISQLQLACALRPAWTEAQVLLGESLARAGKLQEAMKHLREAVRLDPGNAETHCRLATVLGSRHEMPEAIAEYTEALRLKPDLPMALNNLAWIRATHPQAELRNGAEAVRLAERACEATGRREPVFVGTLAAAYAEAGRFEKAVAAACAARELALAAGQRDVAEKNEELIKLFSARKPYREPNRP